jgi:hypothetical protein
MIDIAKNEKWIYGVIGIFVGALVITIIVSLTSITNKHPSIYQERNVVDGYIDKITEITCCKSYLSKIKKDDEKEIIHKMLHDLVYTVDKHLKQQLEKDRTIRFFVLKEIMDNVKYLPVIINNETIGIKMTYNFTNGNIIETSFIIDNGITTVIKEKK